MKELNELRMNPPEGIRVVTNEDNMLDVTGIIEGPGGWFSSSEIDQPLTTSARSLAFKLVEGTPYAGGYFKVKFSFTSEFPAAPPKCRSILRFPDKHEAELPP